MKRKSATEEVIRERYFVACVPTNVLILGDDDREFYLNFWRQAEAERYGMRIEVAPDDLDLFINGMFQARLEAGGFGGLILYAMDEPGVIFLCHGDKRPS